MSNVTTALQQAHRVLSNFYDNAKTRGCESIYTHFHEAAIACAEALAAAAHQQQEKASAPAIAPDGESWKHKCEETERALIYWKAKASAPDINSMVNRFLGWKLPQDFFPDAGVKIDQAYVAKWGMPIGTNLLTADQAKAMFEYCVAAPVTHNPHTGTPRDIASDPEAVLCVEPGQPLHAAQPQPVTEQGELAPLPDFSIDEKFALLIDAQNKAIAEWDANGGSTAPWVRAMRQTSDYLRSVMRDYARAAIAASQQDVVGKFAIDVEKLLCAKLGREWSATGISIESLVDELAARGSQQDAARFVFEHTQPEAMIQIEMQAISDDNSIQNPDWWRDKIDNAMRSSTKEES